MISVALLPDGTPGPPNTTEGLAPETTASGGLDAWICRAGSGALPADRLIPTERDPVGADHPEHRPQLLIDHLGGGGEADEHPVGEQERRQRPQAGDREPGERDRASGGVAPVDRHPAAGGGDRQEITSAGRTGRPTRSPW